MLTYCRGEKGGRTPDHFGEEKRGEGCRGRRRGKALAPYYGSGEKKQHHGLLTNREDKSPLSVTFFERGGARED